MNRIILICTIVLGFSLGCSSQEMRTNKDTAQIYTTIKQQFTEINSKLDQYGKIEKEIFGESSEGGVVMGYYDKNSLKKISAVFYGETGKVITEFYLNNEELFFVFEREFSYDKPMYVDGSKIASIKENRFYFYLETLMKWIKSGKQLINKTSKEFMEKDKLLLGDVERYKKLLGVYKPISGAIIPTTVQCKFGSTCPSTGYIIKG